MGVGGGSGAVGRFRGRPTAMDADIDLSASVHARLLTNQIHTHTHGVAVVGRSSSRNRRPTTTGSRAEDTANQEEEEEEGDDGRRGAEGRTHQLAE